MPHGSALFELFGIGQDQVQVGVVTLQEAPVLATAVQGDDDPLVESLLEHIEWSCQSCFTVVLRPGNLGVISTLSDPDQWPCARAILPYIYKVASCSLVSRELLTILI